MVMDKVLKFLDWVFNRPIQLKEGGFYQSRNGSVYGPLKMVKCPLYSTEFHFVDEATGLTWLADGTFLRHYCTGHDLIKEVTFKPDLALPV